MNWFYNLKISRKLALGFGLLLAACLFLGYEGIAGMKASQARVESMYTDRVQPLADLKVVADGYAVNIVDTSHKARNSNLNYNEAIKNVEAAEKMISEHWKAYTSTEMTPDEQKLIDETVPLMKKGDEQTQNLLAILKKQDQSALAGFTIRNLYPAIDPISDRISKLVELQLNVAKQIHDEGEKAYAASMKQSILMIVAALILGVAAAWIVVRSICRPLEEIKNASELIAQGDFDFELKTNTKDETGQVVNAFRNMSDYLRGNIAIIQNIAHGDLTKVPEVKSSKDLLGNALCEMTTNLSQLVNSINVQVNTTISSSETLAQATQTSLQASQEISSTIEQVASATDESAQTTQKIASGNEQLAQNAMQAFEAMNNLEQAVIKVTESSATQLEVSQKAADVTKEGGVAFRQTVASLNNIQTQMGVASENVRELGRKQQEIGAIVATIDEIAEQTNLLALNAAIEAARAGEHGRGFSVVADEVRRLAERSGEATKEIAQLIQSVSNGVDQAVSSIDITSAEVEKGAEHSTTIQAGYEQILETIAEVTNIASANQKLVNVMVSEAKEVSNSIQAVSEISENTAAATQELSAMTQEMAASAEEVTANIQEQDAQMARSAQLASDFSNSATELMQTISQFKTNNEPSDYLHIAA